MEQARRTVSGRRKRGKEGPGAPPRRRSLSPAWTACLAVLPAAVLWVVRSSPAGWLGWAAGWACLAALGSWTIAVAPRAAGSAFWPALWLAVSMSASHCWAPPAPGAVFFVAFFLASALTARLTDGRWHLLLWVCLWAAASIQLPGVWVAALAYVVSPPPARSGTGFSRYGAAAAAAALVLLAWSRGGQVPWMGAALNASDLLGVGFALCPALLFWLAAGYSRPGQTLRWTAWQVAGWILAWCLTGPGTNNAWFNQDAALCLLLPGAGLGLETLRRDVLDVSWHAGVVWAVLGFSFALALAG